MTTVINKMIRIMGLKYCCPDHETKVNDKLIVFISHMEHHSNHTSWLEANVDLVVLQPDKDLLIDLNELDTQLEKYKDRNFKIGSFTACSNVTGIETPYHEMAKIMHMNGGACFIDFAASAPYVDIDMHHACDEMKKWMRFSLAPISFLANREAQEY